MRLVIDCGNTLKKVSVFYENEIIFEEKSENLDVSMLERIKKDYPKLESSIICSVTDYPKEVDSFLESNFRHFVMNNKLPLPFECGYLQPEKLGMDRAAAVAAVQYLYPGESALAIDAGTCITIDLIQEGRLYCGGLISPGIKMRLKALNHFTNRLPLYEIQDNAELLGRTTQASVLSGVLNGTLAEIDGLIDKYRDEFGDLKVVVSGGDYKYFDKRLKNNIFAIPNIVLLGLNVILEFNDN
ncbi:MAG: type III pantothenate kinase [Bacteroidales bacterium]